MTRPQHLVAAAMIAGLVVGCSATTNPAPSSPAAARATDVAASVDPQVFSDLTALAFPLPGSQVRALRIDRFIGSVMNVDCGGTPFKNLDVTSDRRDQAHFADLDLIARKGLVELGADPRERNATNQDNKCQFSRLPTLPALFAIEGDWSERTLSVSSTPGVKGEEAKAVACLAKQTGLGLKPGDPIGSYFSKVDLAAAKQGSDAELRAWMGRASKAFVECTPSYFDAIKSGLDPARAGAVERNREVLTQVAREVTRAGYVP